MRRFDVEMYMDKFIVYESLPRAMQRTLVNQTISLLNRAIEVNTKGTHPNLPKYHVNLNIQYDSDPPADKEIKLGVLSEYRRQENSDEAVEVYIL